MSMYLDIDDVCADNPVAKAELAQLRAALAAKDAQLAEIRDLARTGLPVGDMTEEQWAYHRLNKIAYLAAHPQEAEE